MAGRRKQRICPGCGKVESVLQSNTSPRCWSCGRNRASALKSKNARVGRSCGGCGAAFTVAQSLLSGKTNSSANYCSRPCYHKVLRGSGLRSRTGGAWHRISDSVKRASPFCAWCGTRHGLQVHHIVPERLTHDDREDNLVPLCTKHHKWIEMMTVAVERATGGHDLLEYFGLILRRRQAMTAILLRSLACR